MDMHVDVHIGKWTQDTASVIAPCPSKGITSTQRRSVSLPKNAPGLLKISVSAWSLSA
jgi:hypothetical protein